MLLTKLKTATALLAAALLTAALGLLTFRAVLAGPSAAKEQPGAEAARDPARGAGGGGMPWGEADGGVRARLRPEKVRWGAGEAPALHLDLRNRGEKTFSAPPLAVYCEVEVDGTWYGRDLSRAVIRALVADLEPGKEIMDWVTISLGGPWLKGAIGPERAEPGREGQALRLAPGKHRVRAAFNDAPGNGFRPVSNAVEIEVLSADPAEAPAAPP